MILLKIHQPDYLKKFSLTFWRVAELTSLTNSFFIKKRTPPFLLPARHGQKCPKRLHSRIFYSFFQLFHFSLFCMNFPDMALDPSIARKIQARKGETTWLFYALRPRLLRGSLVQEEGMRKRGRRRDYDTVYNENTGGTETHEAVDERMHNPHDFANELEEGFASASGVRGETAATDGRIRHPETQDEERSNRLSRRARNSTENENAGLADN